MSRPVLPKTTRPRLHAVLARERLFALLDQARTRPLIWVCGPPGSGKTVLSATYVEANKLPAAWYHLDVGDAEIATFFYFLRTAVAPIAKKRRNPLPLLTAEFAADPLGFARRYMRELGQRLPDAALLVFDNYHEIAPHSALHDVFAVAQEELPSHINVLVISRTDPPAQLARAVASERVSLVDWHALQLDLEETTRIAALRGERDAHTVRDLHQRAGGWAAGLTLLLEGSRRAPPAHRTPLSEARETVFDYFAEQVFKNAKPETRDLLVRTAFLLRFTPQAAQQLTGNPRTASLLDELYRRRLFTDRRGSQQVSYHYHDLFREFLQGQARQTYAATGLQDLQQRSAAALAVEGQIEAAFPLYCTAQDWDAAVALLLSNAKQLVAQGRWKLVLDWIAALPAASVAGNAWLLYWRGVASMASDPARGRASIEPAFRLAERHNDAACRIEAAAAVVESYFLEYSHFTPLDPWIPVLREALDGGFRFATPEAELRVQLALLNALTVRPVALERLPATVARVFELMAVVDDVGLKASAARTIIIVSAHTTQLEVGARAQSLLVPLLDHPSLLPYSRAMCFFALSWYNVQAYDLDKVENYIARTEAMARDEGMPQLARLAHYMAGYSEALRGRFDLASRRALLMEQTMFPDHSFDQASNRLLKGVIGVLSGDPRSAIKYAGQAVELFDQLGSRFHRFAARNNVVIGHVELGNGELAERLMQEVEAVAAEVGFADAALVQNHLVRAYLARKRGDRHTASVLLSKALTFARANDKDCWLMWRSNLYAELWPFALDAGIEVEYVRHLIRKYAWQPSSFATQLWPWRIKIHTFGRFEVLRDDQPLEFSRKAPKRVLSLLKAIIALGRRQVPETRLADALWLGQEGDIAHKSFEVTLRRLRTLLGGDELIELSGGLVSLNEQLCWVDAWAFERALHDDVDASAATSERVLSLYQGNFLPNDAAEPWTVSSRERMRAMFVRCLSEYGKQLEAEQDFQRAIALYQRGIETDDLAESFYQGLMRCYAATDRRAEAMSVFRRLRQTLSVTLGLQPSATTQELALRIGE